MNRHPKYSRIAWAGLGGKKRVLEGGGEAGKTHFLDRQGWERLQWKAAIPIYLATNPSIHPSIHPHTHPPYQAPIYPPTNPSTIHPSTPSSIHSPTHLPTPSSVHPSTHQSIHPPLHPSIHPLTYPSIHTCIHTSFTQPPIFPFLLQSILPPNHTLFHSSIHPSIQPHTFPSIHPSNHPLFHPSIPFVSDLKGTRFIEKLTSQICFAYTLHTSLLCIAVLNHTHRAQP